MIYPLLHVFTQSILILIVALSVTAVASQCVCPCIHVCARVRSRSFPLFRWFCCLAASAQWRVVIHAHVVVFFPSLLSLLPMCSIPKSLSLPPWSASCPLFRACFILSLKTEIYSMCIIWCLNDRRLSEISRDRCRTMIIGWMCVCVFGRIRLLVSACVCARRRRRRQFSSFFLFSLFDNNKKSFNIGRISDCKRMTWRVTVCVFSRAEGWC